MLDPSESAKSAASEHFGHLPGPLLALAERCFANLEHIDALYAPTVEAADRGLTAMQAAELSGRTAGAEWSSRAAWTAARYAALKPLLDIADRYPKPVALRGEQAMLLLSWRSQRSS